MSNGYTTRAEYRKAWERAAVEDPPVPLNVDIELASVCNLSCPFCFISDERFEEMIRQDAGDGKARRRLMPWEMAFRLINEAAAIDVPALKLNWRGESTMHPQYADILRHAGASAFHEVLVNTNANCSLKAVDGLMAATKVMVSLDSLVPETYAVMRRGGDLARARFIVHELIKREHPNVWVRRVLAKENLHEPFFEQVRAEFGSAVKVSEHHCFDRNAASSHEFSGCDHDGETALRTYCGYPSQRLVVASSGLVYPCCIDLHETMPVGDVRHQSLLEIWNGEPMKRLRAELRAGTFTSPACKSCVSWMAYDAPQRAKVQDVEVTR